jgi:hypothetical protein
MPREYQCPTAKAITSPPPVSSSTTLQNYAVSVGFTGDGIIKN